MVDTGNVTQRVNTNLQIMTELSFDVHNEFMVKGIKGHRHFKACILSNDCWSIDAFDFFAHLYKCSSGFFFIGVELVSDLHREKFLVCREIGFCSLNICLQAADPFLQNGYLLWIMLCNVVLQTVFLTGVIGFHQFQLTDLNIQIHLFFYIGIPRCQSLDLCIGKCRFIYVLTTSHRRFACHNLTDKFLLILDELP